MFCVADWESVAMRQTIKLGPYDVTPNDTEMFEVGLQQPPDTGGTPIQASGTTTQVLTGYRSRGAKRRLAKLARFGAIDMHRAYTRPLRSCDTYRPRYDLRRPTHPLYRPGRVIHPRRRRYDSYRPRYDSCVPAVVPFRQSAAAYASPIEQYRPSDAYPRERYQSYAPLSLPAEYELRVHASQTEERRRQLAYYAKYRRPIIG